MKDKLKLRLLQIHYDTWIIMDHELYWEKRFWNQDFEVQKDYILGYPMHGWNKMS